MAKEEYRISDIYQGGPSSLSPKYGTVFDSYRINPSTFGLTTDPRTANVLQDASSKLSAGIKHIEISAVTPQVFESIPRQQLKELNRLSKLTGVDISLHGPIVEPSGMSEQGFSESNRAAAERQMINAIERGHDIKPDGIIPVTFHSSAVGIPGGIPQKVGGKVKELEEGMIINTDTGSVHRVPLKERNFPGDEGKRNIQTEVNKINDEQWVENLRQMEYSSHVGGDAIERAMTTNIIAEEEKKAGKKRTKEEEMMHNEFNRGVTFLNSSYSGLKQLFEVAEKKCSDEEKKRIHDFYKEIMPKAEKIRDAPGTNESIMLMKDIINGGVEILKDVHPKVYEDLNNFAKKKSVETFSNVALSSYKQFKDKAPIISIENPPAGVIFSTGEELKDLVEKAREKFVEKAVREGVGKSEAKEAANRILGVTWDVGHINMLRKFGHEKEDIIKETEAIAPLVKHIHLSDNFGLEHTELPMGMGNVPMKEILDKLGKEGFNAKKIIEASGWWEHFKSSPFQATLEAFGSPIYGMEMGPYWNQSMGLQQGYFSGYGSMLPQMNYETFGAGFSRLPAELGGQRGGAEGSRMSGRPME